MIISWIKKIFKASPPPKATNIEEEKDDDDENMKVTEEITLPSSSLSMEIKAVVLSDVGCVRQNNEDSARFMKPSNDLSRKGVLVIVADGMGGHAAGEIASQIAVETISEIYFKTENETLNCLSKAFQLANQKIYAASQSKSSQRGMGTTCTTVVIQQQKIYFGQVGDSRFYHLHEGKLYQVSTDQTMVQQLVQQGKITPEEVKNHPDRNVLTNAMGTKPSIEIDVQQSTLNFEANDRLMLCSDGLYEYLKENEIAEYLTFPTIREAAQAMIDTAKYRGGHDNITVIVMEQVPVNQDVNDKSTTAEIDI